MLDLEDDLPQELEEFADNFVDFCPLNERPGRKATIYRARSCFVDQTVAIKIVPKPEVDGELDLVQRLRNEAVATAAASHPNIVRIQHGGITREGHAYILLEYLDGRALSRLLQEAPLEPARALDIAIDVASALVALHDKGIIHNAVTPDNIIVTQAAAKLVDLSLAYVPQLPGYPERREGPARRPFECLRCEPSDPRRDVYGLAATLWAALLGGYRSTVDPMVVDSSTTVRALGAVPSVDLLPPSVPATLREVISRGIASAPEERYTCMADLLTALRVERALWSAQDLSVSSAPAMASAAKDRVPAEAANRAEGVSGGRALDSAAELLQIGPLDFTDEPDFHREGDASTTGGTSSSTDEGIARAERPQSASLRIADAVSSPLPQAVGAEPCSVSLVSASPAIERRSMEAEREVRALLGQIRTLQSSTLMRMHVAPRWPQSQSTPRSRPSSFEYARAIQLALRCDADATPPGGSAIDRLLDEASTLPDPLPASPRRQPPSRTATGAGHLAGSAPASRPTVQSGAPRRRTNDGTGDSVHFDLVAAGHLPFRVTTTPALPDPKGTLLVFPPRRSEPVPPPILRSAADSVRVDLRAMGEPPRGTQTIVTINSWAPAESGFERMREPHAGRVPFLGIPRSQGSAILTVSAGFGLAAAAAMVLALSLSDRLAVHRATATVAASVAPPVAAAVAASDSPTPILPSLGIEVQPDTPILGAAPPEPPPVLAAVTNPTSAPSSAVSDLSAHLGATGPSRTKQGVVPHRPASSGPRQAVSRCPPGLYPPACKPALQHAAETVLLPEPFQMKRAF